MTDSQTLPPDPVSDVTQDDPISAASAPSASGDDSNPLDALEQILKDAKAKGGGKADSKEAEEAALRAQQEEQHKQEEMARLAAEQKLEDQKMLAEQIKNLQSVSETPEEQARVAQSADKLKEEEDRHELQEENAIHQLGHTKI